MPAQVFRSSIALSASRRRHGLLDYISLYRQRRALARLDAAALRDIGLTEGQATGEALRPVWDVPVTWRR